MVGNGPLGNDTQRHSRQKTLLGKAALRRCWLALLPVIVTLRTAAAADAPTGQAPPSVDYAIVVTGGELLAGAYPDGHTHFLTRTLRPLGLRCVGSMCVDDRQADLKAALGFATGKASLVIVTGGLGPTDNDITRTVLSEFTGIALREHAEVLQAMAKRFGVSVEQMRPNLRQQTQVPIHGTYLNNGGGTAVGLVFETAGKVPDKVPDKVIDKVPGKVPDKVIDKVIVALPGPPRELQAMVRGELVPYLSRRFGTRRPGCSLTLRFVGLGQSQIDQTLEQHVPLPSDVVLCSQFEGGRVDFTFSLPFDTPQDRARLEEIKQKILEHLGDHVYAEGQMSLEQCVVKMLQARGATLALVEAGSGGSLAAGLSGADGEQTVLAGGFVAADEEKLRRILRVPDDRWAPDASPEQRVELLAQAAAGLTGSQWVVAVGQPGPGAGGARFVDVVFRRPDGRHETQRVGLRDGGESARARLVTQLLDQLRRKLNEAVSPGGQAGKTDPGR